MRGKERPLSIVGFDDRDQHHPKDVILPEWMPMHEFFMLIVAPAGSGKTTLILNLLLRIYHHYFHKIKVFSPTIHNDQKWKHLTNSKDVLRPNPHRSLWSELEEDESNNADGGNQDDGDNDFTAEEKEWLEMAKDTFDVESFGTGKSKSKTVRKRLGKEHKKMWDMLAKTVNKTALHNRQNIDPKSIIEKKRRVERLSSFISKPTAPILNKSGQQFYNILGFDNPSLHSIDGEQGEGVGNAGGSGGRSGSGGAARTLNNRYGKLHTQSAEPSYLGVQYATATRNCSGFGQIGLPHVQDPLCNFRRLLGETGSGGGRLEETDVSRLPVDHRHGSGNTSQDRKVKNPKKQNKFKGLHDKGQLMISKEKDLFEDYTEETLQKIMTDQDKVVAHLTKKDQDMTQADHLCLVFDDMVGSGLFNMKKNNAFKRLTVRRRHFCASVIGVVQAYKEFPRTSRTNSNVYILFRIDSEDELTSIYTDFPCGLDWMTWRAVYDYCTKDAFSFMMINLQVKNPTFRIIKNFDEPLYIPADKKLIPQWVQQFIPQDQNRPPQTRQPNNEWSSKSQWPSQDSRSQPVLEEQE